MITYTPIYAALLALLYLFLTVRVIYFRRTNRVSFGDGDSPELLGRIRAHGNLAEYAPFGLVLLLLIEITGFAAIWVNVFGILFLTGRLFHAWSVSQVPMNIKARTIGMAMTINSIAMMSITLLGALFV